MTERKRVCAAMAVAILLSGTAGVATRSATSSATTSARGTSRAAIAVALPFGVSVIDPVCKPVFDATHKTLDTANHMFTDMAVMGKMTTNEMITVNGDRYIMLKGKWTKSRMTVASTKEQEAENIKDAKVLSCKRIGDDVVGGEAATVYTEHSENDDTKSDGKIWVSKSRGLILKEEIVLDSGEAEKQHITLRYEYGNVKAPI